MASSTDKTLDPSIASSTEADVTQDKTVSLEDEMVLLLAGMMEPGLEDEDICKALKPLTSLLGEDPAVNSKFREPHTPLYKLIDADSIDTILGFLDMRQAPAVRSYATMATSEYLKVSGDTGVAYLSDFFFSKVGRATYDDFILAFSVAASIFPVVPDVIATLFLSEGFVVGLGPLMKRKWKSKKVEQAALEMLNVACMNSPCREAIKKYCTEWLEEIVTSEHVDSGFASKSEAGSIQQRVHSEKVKALAAVVLAKIQAIPSTQNHGEEVRVKPATTSVEELADIFKKFLGSESSQQSSIEGLAYTSLQPKVKENLASDKAFLKKLITALGEAPAKSPATYGVLSILANLTLYMPNLSEEQKRMSQLKAYANAAKSSSATEPLNDDENVAKRCQAVFEAGVIPVLVTHSQHGSTASLTLVISIIFSLAKSSHIRGQMAQQGAVKLLLLSYPSFPPESAPAQRTTAHALARILISTNPSYVFGGSNPLSLTSAVRPLLSLLTDDSTVENRDLLPVFESLLALTNLASTDDIARNAIIRPGFSQVEELLLSGNKMVTRAAVELVCNLVLSPEGVSKFADGGKLASQRMHIILALGDSEDYATRRASGGALASLTEWDAAVNAILERDSGVRILLALCTEEQEELRHRGVVCILNIMTAPGKVGEWGVKKVRDASGVEALRECLKKSRSHQVSEITVEALKALLGSENSSPVLG